MKFYAILYWRKISVYLLIGIFGVVSELDALSRSFTLQRYNTFFDIATIGIIFFLFDNVDVLSAFIASLVAFLGYYIIPPMPPPWCAWGSSLPGLSTMRHSVVSNMLAIEAAFSKATRATLVGSITPSA